MGRLAFIFIGLLPLLIAIEGIRQLGFDWNTLMIILLLSLSLASFLASAFGKE